MKYLMKTYTATCKLIEVAGSWWHEEFVSQFYPCLLNHSDQNEICKPPNINFHLAI